jgi:hypothetical protein
MYGIAKVGKNDLLCCGGDNVDGLGDVRGEDSGIGGEDDCSDGDRGVKDAARDISSTLSLCP